VSCRPQSSSSVPCHQRQSGHGRKQKQIRHVNTRGLRPTTPGCGIVYLVVKIKMPSERFLRLAGHELTSCLISCAVPPVGPCPCGRARARVIDRSIIRAGFGWCGDGPQASSAASCSASIETGAERMWSKSHNPLSLHGLSDVLTDGLFLHYA
jgi:hypothetical protein